MKRIILMAALASAIPVAAFAGNVDLSNNGTIAGGSSGLSLSGAELTEVTGLGGGPITGVLGSVSFTTGALLTGNLITGATFAPSGPLTISGNGTSGIPNSVLFNGTFTSDVTWTENLNCGLSGEVCYTLSGSVSGTWFNGMTVSGTMTEKTSSVDGNGFAGSIAVATGDTVITLPTPEPSSLLLLGTGLLSLAGIKLRRIGC